MIIGQLTRVLGVHNAHIHLNLVAQKDKNSHMPRHKNCATLKSKNRDAGWELQALSVWLEPHALASRPRASDYQRIGISIAAPLTAPNFASPRISAAVPVTASGSAATLPKGVPRTISGATECGVGSVVY